MNDNVIVIGIGEYVVVEGPTKISTMGLGSCIGTVIYDENGKISGMSHIMLPKRINPDDKIGKYADTALPAMINDMIKKGADKHRMKAKIAGGASLFDFKDDTLRIGERNAEAVEEVLKNENIRITGKDVGGDRGRTIIFDPVTTELFIKMVKKGPNEPEIKII
ncbi:MAG: chemotaxis protein CheD [Candidatus Thermoplasmatota archaeon]